MDFHAVGEKYVDAVRLAGGLPLIVPAIGDDLPVEQLLSRIDGILVTGSPSNVEPHHYVGSPSREGTLHDPDRDATTLPLIPAAIDAGVPMLAICRGMQELNVTYGGTLHQHIEELPGKLDHRAPAGEPNEIRYALAHTVTLTEDGVLRRLADDAVIQVNSLHAQGVDRLADRLVVEAVAPDGVIEAVSVGGAPNFAVGIQWHPEWRADEMPFARNLFAAFAAAARARAGRVGRAAAE